jgi:hypothetical protein
MSVFLLKRRREQEDSETTLSIFLFTSVFVATERGG